ncbi:MAG TPA: Ig-like domain-containing protein [Fontimonas sp.]
MRLFSNGWRLLAISGLVAFLGACGNNDNNEVRLRSIEIAPATQSIASGTTVQLTATALYSDGNTFNVSDQVIWDSSDDAKLSVSNSGLATGLAPSNGAVTVTATLDEATSTAAITVTAATIKQIQISPDSGALPRGLSRQLQATAIFTDNTQQDVTASAAWVSLDTSVATVGNTATDKGRVTAVGGNSTTTTITASKNGVTGSLPVRVSAAALESIQVSPASAKMAVQGFEKQFTATGIFSDGTTGDITDQVVWKSTMLGRATISNADGEKGLLTTGNLPGDTMITASAGGKDSPAVTVTVTSDTLQSIEIDAINKRFAPANSVSAGLGRTLQFVATGKFSGTTPALDISRLVTWNSSDLTVATISNADATKGKSVTQGPGTTSIAASVRPGSGSEVVRTITLTVTSAELVSMVVEPSSLTVPRSFKAPLRVVGTFSDSSQEDISADVTWTSQDSNTAVVGNTAAQRGVVTGGNPGSTVVTASYPGTGINATANINVSGATLQAINIQPQVLTIPQSTTTPDPFKAIASFSDGSTLDVTNYGQVVWSSSDTNVATANASPNGAFTGTAQGGTVQIVASRPGSELRGVATLNVDGVALVQLRVVPRTFEGCTATTFSAAESAELVAVGAGRRFMACARFRDGFIGDVTSQATWASQAPGVITVGTTGALRGRVTTTGREKERGVIEATYTENGITMTDTEAITLVDGTITVITITASRDLTAQLPAGTVVQFESVASIRSNDGTTATGVNVTEGATWTSSETSVVVISNTDGSRGSATVQAAAGGGLLGGSPPSSSDIRASRGGINSNTLTVNRAP